MADRLLDSPRFGTILAARGNDSRPSDLEFLLRSHSDKIRVVERLHGGAHLLLPKVAGTSSSLAIRVYEEMEHDGVEQEDGAMEAFFDSFQMTIVFFVLPAKKQGQALDDIHSAFHRAQRLAMRATRQTRNSNNGVTPVGKDKWMTRVCLVPDSPTALSILFSIIDSIPKREIRSLYFQRQQDRYFSPRMVVHHRDPRADQDSRTVSTITTNQVSMIPESCRSHAAIHIAETLRSWSNRFDLPPGEINVLMSLMGSMAKIATTAHHDDGLDMVPLEDRTKRIVRAFFGIPTSHKY